MSGEILGAWIEAWERDQFGIAMKMLQISQNGISEHLHIEYGNRLKRQKDAEQPQETKPVSGATPAGLACPVRPTPLHFPVLRSPRCPRRSHQQRYRGP